MFTKSVPDRLGLRPSAKSLPEDARVANRALVLQALYSTGAGSRADLARRTGLTRVTTAHVSEDLLAEGLVREREDPSPSRRGRPSRPLEIDREGLGVVGIDLSRPGRLCGALLDVDGHILERREADRGSRAGRDLVEEIGSLAGALVRDSGRRIVGVGVGTPGVVDSRGVVRQAPILGWRDLAVADHLRESIGLPVVVANDANVAMLAEYTFGGAADDAILLRIGTGVGGGVIVGGSLLTGARFSAGEIGHVTSEGSGPAELCVCGRRGCLETWIAEPPVRLKIAREPSARARILEDSGHRLGLVLAPLVAALDLAEVVLAGPRDLLEDQWVDALAGTLNSHVLPLDGDPPVVRWSRVGDDIVLRGAAALVLATRWGVS